MDDAFNRTAALLGPDDPAAVTIENPNGGAPVLVLCDHASNAVPASLHGLGLTERELHLHIAFDIAAADLASRLALLLDAPAVLSGYSRLVIDCNRQPDHAGSIVAESDSIPIPGNEGLDEEQNMQRRQEIFWPYHQKIGAGITGFAAKGIKPAIVSVHSFTKVFAGEQRPWQIGILWDRDARIAKPLIAALRSHGEFNIGDNLPYSGRQHFGYSIETHATETGLPNVLIELREDIICEPEGARRLAEILGHALGPILADSGLYRSQRF